MIAGVFIRNFKVYKNIHYIPLTRGSKFSALIGANGVGKSTVFEAIDCFFNHREWIDNIGNNGHEASWVMPVFVLKKNGFDLGECADLADRLTEFVLNAEISEDATGRNIAHHIKKFRESLPSVFTKDYYVLPLGLNSSFNADWAIFQLKNFKTDVFPDINEDNLRLSQLSELIEKVKSLLTYVYIQKDIEPQRLVRFENEEIQHLIGKDLTDIVSKSLSTAKVNQISKSLREFIDGVSEKLISYKFKTEGVRQKNIKPQVIYDIIIKEFFSIRTLYKIVDAGKDISLEQLSSGEKQQAIISLITQIAGSYRENVDRLIVAVDEPESSLHVSLCYEQFEKLHDLSEICCQLMLASHWYGFIPALPDGTIVNISKNNVHEFDLFDIEKYKEEMRQVDNRMHGELPVDVLVKSNNDLVQSIICSIIKEDCYNWLICEGSSDKIYLSAYFEEEIKNKHLRIIPVCKASEIKKMYFQLASSLEDLKRNINGKVFLLTDTDSEMNMFDAPDKGKYLMCRRIVNALSENKTKLVGIQSNPVSPNTDIENALNGKLFHKTILEFKPQNPELEMIQDDSCEEIPSYMALNLGPQDYLRMDKFFSKNNGENKVIFAKKYVENMNDGEYVVPAWIEEIRNYFYGE